MAGLVSRGLKAMRFLIKHVSRPETQTYYPDAPRKSRRRIAWENICWLLKHREINHFYYLYGFDRNDFSNPRDYFPEQAFCRIRDKANAFRTFGEHRARYICMLQDKFVFGIYMQSLGFPTPPLLGLCDAEKIDWLNPRRQESWDKLAEHDGMDAFLKDALGRCGTAVFPLRVSGGTVYLNDKPVDAETLRQKITGKYVIQQRIYQHPELNRMYPHAINTIRLITLRKGDDILLASGTFRMGAGGNRFDNWAGGGIGVGLNVKTGQLDEEGTYRLGFGGRVAAHPETGVVFRTYKIPFYREAAELVVQMHSFFYGVHSIGWDVAVTQDGPVVIEGNNSWDIAFQQFHDNKIKRTFLDTLNGKQ